MSGGSLSQLVVFGPSRQDVAAVLADREVAISPTLNNYTLVVDAEFESPDSSRILALATQVSSELHCPALLVQRVTGDVLSYSLIDNGVVVDAYNSDPDYYDIDVKHVVPRGPQGGDVERLCQLLEKPNARDQVDHILHRQDPTLDPYERYRKLADALGMPSFSARFGVGVLHGNYPDGLGESDVWFTPVAREARDTEKEWYQPKSLKREEQSLTSGKRVIRSLDVDGLLVSEVHVHRNPRGATAIGLEMRFAHGRKIGESYFGNGHVVNREVYERERLQYEDMPAADSSVRDFGAEGLEELALIQQARRAQQPGNTDRAQPAQWNDVFCRTVIDRGRAVNAIEWLRLENHTLDELDSTRSRALIAKFVELGVVAIHACNVHSAPDGHESSGRLVLELPKEPASRAAILRAIRPFAKRHGYSNDFDNGQRYAYVRVGP